MLDSLNYSSVRQAWVQGQSPLLGQVCELGLGYLVFPRFPQLSSLADNACLVQKVMVRV